MRTTPIAVYWRWTPFTAAPDFFIPRREAEELCRQKKGRFFRHGRALQLAASPPRSHFPLRDASCCVDKRIIEANAEGDPHARAVVAGWELPMKGE